MTSPGGSGRPLMDELGQRFPEEERERLYARVLHGDVLVNGHRERNPRTLVSRKAEITMALPGYMSRGGRKLGPVLQEAGKAGFDYRGRVLLDAGASSGGFTDCLLKHGARAVHTVDVGYNLLDYRLRSDGRVHVHERCNIMSLRREDLQPPPFAAVADLSFRSLAGAASRILGLLYSERPQLLALIKPQFELTYSGVALADFSGVIKDDGQAAEILDDFRNRLAEEGLRIYGLWPSGLPGRRGNKEFFGLIASEDGQALAPAGSHI